MTHCFEETLLSPGASRRPFRQLSHALPKHNRHRNTRDGNTCHEKKPTATYLAPAAVVQVVVVQAQDGGEVGHQRVRLPAAVLEPPPERAHGVTPKDRCQPTHEGRLSATGVGGHTDKNNLLGVVGVVGRRRISGEEDE